MKLIIQLILVCSLALPAMAFADDLLHPSGDTVKQLSLENPTLLDRLIAQEVSYQLDSASSLTFNCNVAAISSRLLQEDDDTFAPDVRVQLVVRF